MAFDLEVSGTLLIRSPGLKAGEPDVLHLTEEGKRILSGTSLAGALRSHAGRLLKTLEWTIGQKSQVTLASLFGPSPEELEKGASPAASRVVVDEVTVVGGDARVQSRVKIDRFTGGALDTALFDEAPSMGGRVRFTVRVIEPPEEKQRNAEIGLMLLAARDLAAGLVPIGGGVAVGRGILRGSGMGAVVVRERAEPEKDLAVESHRKALEEMYISPLLDAVEGEAAK
jgi:hypothetical protein